MSTTDEGDDDGVIRIAPDSTRVPEVEALDPDSGSVSYTHLTLPTILLV